MKDNENVEWNEETSEAQVKEKSVLSYVSFFESYSTLSELHEESVNELAYIAIILEITYVAVLR